MLRAGLGLLCAFTLPKPGRAADFAVQAWLDANGVELPELTNELARWERTAIAQSFPAVRNCVKYITVIRWVPGIVFCVGTSPDDATAMLAAAKTATHRAGSRVLAEGWSDDRRVWAFFATGDMQTLAPIMETIAPPVKAWREFDLRSVHYRLPEPKNGSQDVEPCNGKEAAR
jgi:hypothetical protein